MEAVREKIVQAAANCLIRHGYTGTSIRTIATEANVAIGNIQYYFPTKDQLVVEAFEHLTGQCIEKLRQVANNINRPAETLEKGIPSLWECIKELARIQLASYDVLIEYSSRHQLHDNIYSVISMYKDVLLQMIEDWNIDSSSALGTTSEQLASLCLMLIFGLSLYYAVTHDESTCQSAVDALITIAHKLISP
jgi:AcrR family transcriptional regulator